MFKVIIELFDQFYPKDVWGSIVDNPPIFNDYGDGAFNYLGAIGLELSAT